MIIINTKGMAKTLRILGIISIFFIAYFELSKSNFNYPLWLLPLSYVIGYNLCGYNLLMLKDNFGATILNIVMFIRYVVTPFIIYATGELSKYANNYNYMAEAIYLMFYELCIVFMCLEVTGKYYFKKGNLEIKNNVDYQLNPQQSLLFSFILTILFIGVTFTKTNLITGFNVLYTGKSNNNLTDSGNNVLGILWEVMLVWLYVFIIKSLAIKYHSLKQNKYFMFGLLWTIVFIFLTFLGSASLSRWYTLVSAIAALTYVTVLFAEKRKVILRTILVPTFSLILLLTLYKQTGYTYQEDTFFASLLKIFNSTTFDTYFAGPTSVNNAIGLKTFQLFNFSTFFRDILNNMPIVNKYLAPATSTSYGYNAYIGRLFGGNGDQIIPLIGQSAIYLGYFLSPILSIISVWIVRIADYKVRIEKSYLCYLYAFLSVWFAVGIMMLNVTIMFSWIFIRIIPIFFCLFLTKKISQMINIDKI